MDTIANLITSLRNAEMASHTTVTVPSTKLSQDLLAILKQKGIIAKFESKSQEPQDTLEIDLINGTRHHYKRISKPGRRVYTKVKHIPTVLQGLGMVVISTPQGLMTGQDARKQKLGGEILCEIY